MEAVDHPMSDAPPAESVADAAPTSEVAQTEKNEVVESIEVDAAGEQDNSAIKDDDAPGDASDAEGEDDDNVPDTSGRPVSNQLYKGLKAITDILTDFKIKKGGEDYFPSLLFKRVPNKRNLPDYYQIIKEPSAISTLKGKIQRKSYTGIPEFVRDFALIVHNAQVYNRPNSQPVRDVFQLDALFKAELQKLVDQGLVKEEETVFPELGEIPAATPEPDPVSEEEEEDGDDDEGEEDEEDGDDSEDGGRRKRKARPSGDDEKRKRRGRPPKVDTPLEARIKSVIKSLRRPKDEQGMYRLRHFERLPDKAEYPHYYQEIKEPIAMDIIKKKAKRKKYNSVDNFMKDIDLMFKNAMTYNVDGSEIYEDAKALLVEARQLAQAEKAKPDSVYAAEDGRIPLSDGIQYKGETWKVGDWIHVQNPNDVTKPIVAQIYRTWKDSEGQDWINACWYYRPEQTIHQYERHFYPNEVMKTGQYRDHHIQEVLDRCFVMFFTRYNRGRPRHIDPKAEVYVCECRYNEEKHKFNKIKTWASCLPDEVRDKDYEMDLFDVPRRIKKIPSPIKHLLKENVQMADLAPQWGSKNAPPVVGAVHGGVRDDNQSPPPEPTPPPQPTPAVPAIIRQPSANMGQSHHYPPRTGSSMPSHQTIQPQVPRPASSATPSAPPYHNASASPAPQYGRPPLYQQGSSGYQPTAQSPAAQASPYATAQQIIGTPSYQPNAQGQGYASAAPVQQPYQRQTIQQAQAQQAVHQQQQSQQQQYQSMPQQNYPQYSAAPHERHPEAYVLSDAANAAIPKDIRDRFPQDDEGRILFFTKPPLDTRHIVTGRSEAEKNKPLGHTKEYLEAKAKRNELIKERKRKIQESIARDAAANDYTPPPPGYFGEERDPDGRIKADPEKAAQIIKEYQGQEAEKERKAHDEALEKLSDFVQNMRRNMVKATSHEYQSRYGDNALRYFEEDSIRSMNNQIKWEQERLMEEQKKKDELTKDEKIRADTHRMLSQNKWTGKFPDGTGYFKDDYENPLFRRS